MFCLRNFIQNPASYKQTTSFLYSINATLLLNSYSRKHSAYFSTSSQNDLIQTFNTGLQTSRYCRFDESVPHFQQIISTITADPTKISKENALLLVQAYHRLGEAHKEKERLGDSLKGYFLGSEKKERFVDSLKEYLQGLEIVKRNNLEKTREAGLLYHSLAELLVEKSQFDEARAYLEKAKDVFSNINEDSCLIENGYLMGLLYNRRNETSQAIELWENILKSDKRSNREFNPGYIYLSLGRSYYQGNQKKAKECWEKSVEVTEKEYGKESIELLPVYLRLTEILYEYKQLKEAIIYAEKAVEIAEKHLKSDEADLGRCNFIQGLLYSETRDYARAYETLQKALNIYLNHTSERKEEIADVYLKISETLVFLEKREQAWDVFEKGKKFVLEHLGAQHPKHVDYGFFSRFFMDFV